MPQAGVIAPPRVAGEWEGSGMPSRIFLRSTATYCYPPGARNAL